MKTIYCAILAGLMAGCASVSQYNQGCRAGVENLVEQINPRVLIDSEIEAIDHYCDNLDTLHNKAIHPANQLRAK